MPDGKKPADLSQGRNAWTAHKTDTPAAPEPKKPTSLTAHKTGTPADAKREGYAKSPDKAIAKDFGDQMNKKGAYKPVKASADEEKPKPAPGKAIAKEFAAQANRKKYAYDEDKPPAYYSPERHHIWNELMAKTHPEKALLKSMPAGSSMPKGAIGVAGSPGKGVFVYKPGSKAPALSKDPHAGGAKFYKPGENETKMPGGKK